MINSKDNCVSVVNPGQQDDDADGVGNACDPTDNRGGPPPVPPPPVVPGPTVADRDRDLVPDATDNCPDAANATQADRDRDRVGDVCDVSDASAGPSLGKTVVGRLISGEVFVRRPAGSTTRSGARVAQAPAGFTRLQSAGLLPVGTVVDAVRGRLALTAVAAPKAKGATPTQRAEFFEGIFQLRQKKAKKPVTDLILKSASFPRVCGTRSRAVTATAAQAGKKKKVVARLRGNGNGRFRTTGRHSAATVRGTIWLTEERCDGTLTRVTRSFVSVRDFVAKKTVTVRAGDSYLARATRATIKARRRR